ncbi:NAD(P)H-binding protein [Dactylosporangium vinaceum]|uniref:SDR family oxidoreductase n=1 Tax=Dactylosporangium vinaceum TaxID=53362 RepID=A0ABV5ME86_9ACTN|nr:NAD(P)H-binding protein [Dactylosporangium vinaceum]UAB92475.1 NAD(P)H-binding protein [Dactylosporangium vinaceum]
MTVVVFGARGQVGRHVLAGLRDAGRPVRATGRSGPVIADLDRPETLPGALEGATAAFLYAHPAGIDGFVAAARAAGVRRVALLSSAAVTRPDAEQNPIARRHRAVEEALERSGLAWTFVRGGMFASNTIGLWAPSIRAESTVRLAYPDAQSAPVHEADLAALAVAALVTGEHDGRAYTVHGPASLSQADQVAAIAAALDRPITVERVSPAAARAEMVRSLPEAVADRLLHMWAAAGGAPVATSPQLATRTFAEWAAAHAEDFR